MKPTKKNILILTYWSYNSSILESYAIPYIAIIRKNIAPESKVFLFTLTAKSESDKTKFLKRKEELKNQGIELLNYNYTPFGFTMAMRFIYILFSLIVKTFTNRIDYIHGWCTTGGSIGYIISIFTRRPLILDSFEPHAKSMVEAGTWRKNSLAFRILFILEKLELKRASKVICATEGMIEFSQLEYGITKSDYFVKPACVDLNLFSRKEKNFSLVDGIGEDSVVCVYAGKFGDIYLSEEVFDFFAIAAAYWGNRFKVLLLTNHSKDEINSFCKKAGLDSSIVTGKFVEHKDVPLYLSLGNFGICPVRPVPTKKYCTPIKNGEYWAIGLPVVITKDISEDSELIRQNNIGYELQSLSTEEYQKAVKKIDELLPDKSLASKIRLIAESKRNYSIAENIYKLIYV